MAKILLTGKNGQVGYELERSLQGLGEVVALDRNGMDLSNLDQVRDKVREIGPTLIVNPAAYTAVDKAESEPELAHRINALAPAVMAEEAKKLGAAMIHYSTDYVFDGTKALPYLEEDVPCPLNEYGKSKLAGEQAVQAAGIPYLILRTSWVYGMRGRNFLLTMLRLAGERTELSIVADQHGAPTWCRTVADTTAHILSQSVRANGLSEWWEQNSGLYHLAAQGITTWHGFAAAIFEQHAVEPAPALLSISSSAYPTPAKRPANSAMSCERLQQSFCSLPHWESALNLCMTK